MTRTFTLGALIAIGTASLVACEAWRLGDAR